MMKNTYIRIHSNLPSFMTFHLEKCLQQFFATLNFTFFTHSVFVSLASSGNLSMQQEKVCIWGKKMNIGIKIINSNNYKSQFKVIYSLIICYNYTMYFDSVYPTIFSKTFFLYFPATTCPFNIPWSPVLYILFLCILYNVCTIYICQILYIFLFL